MKISDSNSISNPILVALDVPARDQALSLVDRLRPHVGGFKVGLELFCSCGPSIVEEIGAEQVFLDLKFHDIPNTVAGVSRVASRLGVLMFNVHCLGGLEMMLRAVEAAREENTSTHVLGVTILTSHDTPGLERLGLREEPQIAVRRLALLARESGLDGVVCSPQEAAGVRAECGADFLLVTPGIRGAQSERGDQKRTLSAPEAIQEGANWLVVGRPITQSNDVVEAAREIAATIG